MSGPRSELVLRLRRRLADVGVADADVVASVVAGCFHEIRDEWDHLPITTMRDDGEVWMHQRYLVARWCVQGMRVEQLADRSVKE